MHSTNFGRVLSCELPHTIMMIYGLSNSGDPPRNLLEKKFMEVIFTKFDWGTRKLTSNAGGQEFSVNPEIFNIKLSCPIFYLIYVHCVFTYL